MPTKARPWEKVFVVLTLFTFCRGFDLIFIGLAGVVGAPVSVGRTLDESNPVRFAWLLGLSLTATVLLFRHHGHQLAAVLSQNKLLILLMAFFMISSIWSVEPVVTARRAAAYGLTTVFCIYLALRFRPDEILGLAASTTTIVALLSIIAGIAFPEISGPQAIRKVGAWAGIMPISTFFGRVMALGVLSVWCLRRTEWQLQRYDAIVFLVLVVCLWQSQAMTAIVATAAGLMSLVLLWTSGPALVPIRVRLAIGAFIIVPFLVIIPSYFEDIMAFIGRDPTLTNRVYIWQAAYEQGLQRPLLGVGFRSFWTEGNVGGVLYNIFGSRGTLIGNGHNGYLDVWLELGVAGLMLLGLLLLQALARVTHYIGVERDAFGSFYMALTIYILIYSIAEKVIFEHSEITWTLFITGLVAMKWRATVEEQTRELAPDLVSPEPLL